jgi:hypothetical protein
MRKVIFGVVLAGLLVAGCGGGSKSGTGGGATTAGGGSGASGGSSAASHSYSYVNNGIEASLTLAGGSGTLQITNNGSKDLGAPTLYSLDPTTGDRVDATVTSSAPIAKGATASLSVSFPSGFDVVAAGFVGIEFGGQDFGGFVDA